MDNNLALVVETIAIVIVLLFVLKRYGFIFSPHIARALRNTKYIDFRVIRNSTVETYIIEMWYKNSFLFYYTPADAMRAICGSQIYAIHKLYKERNPHHG